MNYHFDITVRPAILTEFGAPIEDAVMAELLYDTLSFNFLAGCDSSRIKSVLSLYLRHYPDKREIVEHVAKTFHRNEWKSNS